MSLHKYHNKRSFTKTTEPKGNVNATTTSAKKGKVLRFVVQKHQASRLHYDFRLEMEGVLKSWAVPKGPSMDPEDKPLAVQVEDHPFEYRKFEGVIPEGNYGAGTVEIWDEGTYSSMQDGKNQEEILLDGLKKGDVKFRLYGKKLQGSFALVQIKKDPKNWLLIKHKEDNASATSAKDQPTQSKKSPMPHNMEPMLAESSENAFNDPEWLYELKWDGYRAIAEIEKRKVKLVSRNAQDFTHKYQSIVKELEKIPLSAVLDGEIVAVDKEGKPKFQLLQSLDEKTQLIYYVFDLLYLDGYDIRSLPLTERKTLLKKLLHQSAHIKYSEHIDTHGTELYAVAKKRGIEGIVAKKKYSRYVSKRSSEWRKIKHINMQEAIICGYTEPNGLRKEFGALILGVYSHGELQYVGHSGSGFDEKTLQGIIKKLKPLVRKSSPFSHTPQTNTPATWVTPKIVCQIKFSEWTTDGMMRHPIFLGLREDKKPEEVAREIPEKTTVKANVPLSNLTKVYWPEEGYTKGDLIAYYDRIAEYILPYLADRPESLNRHPDGIHGESFYHKDLHNLPSWLKTVPIYSDSNEKYLNWLICNDRETLLYMANLGCIEINPWSSRHQNKDHPDYLIIDLDPNDIDFLEVIRTAKEVKKVLDEIGIEGFLKTSGKKGLHILIPLGEKYTFDQARQFAEILAMTVHERLPDTTSLVRDPKKREKKVYIDFLQNRQGQTLAAPYSLRPVRNACVSTPLQWNELTTSLRPTDFTIKNIFRRLGRVGDIWEPFRTHPGIDMLQGLENIAKV
jgi:bifunctional non-homologous end joining protein LigD